MKVGTHMTLNYRFTYQPCEFCVGKNHCAACQAEIAAHLRGLPGVRKAQVNRPEASLAVTCDDIDPLDLEDALEAIGVFVS